MVCRARTMSWVCAVKEKTSNRRVRIYFIISARHNGAGLKCKSYSL
jgi:hypothetical protein